MRGVTLQPPDIESACSPTGFLLSYEPAQRNSGEDIAHNEAGRNGSESSLFHKPPRVTVEMPSSPIDLTIDKSGRWASSGFLFFGTRRNAVGHRTGVEFVNFC
jgi:hypothetical protein